MAAVTRSGLIFNKDGASLQTKPGFLFKNQNSRHPTPPDITFPALPGNHTLCPVAALRYYQTKTQSGPHDNLLFVHPSSGKPLQAGRMSFWLAKAIKIGDPDAIKPAGHDIRKFSHSIANFRQVKPTDILKNGFWHSPNVFVHKYLISCRPNSVNFVAGRVI